MRILLFVPTTVAYHRSIESIFALDVGEHEVTLLFERAGDHSDDRWDNVTLKYQKGRSMALGGGYDYLFCIEDDIIVPESALLDLLALGTDVAYGLTVYRREPYSWSAGLESGPGQRHVPVTDYADNWGEVIPVEGCGLFCTLINRRTLAAVPFRRQGERCCDFDFAVDVKAHRLTQLCDTRVVCKHITDEGDIVWPSKDGYVRHDNLIPTMSVPALHFDGVKDTQLQLGLPANEIMDPDFQNTFVVRECIHPQPCPACGEGS